MGVWVGAPYSIYCRDNILINQARYDKKYEFDIYFCLVRRVEFDNVENNKVDYTHTACYVPIDRLYD